MGIHFWWPKCFAHIFRKSGIRESGIGESGLQGCRGGTGRGCDPGKADDYEVTVISGTSVITTLPCGSLPEAINVNPATGYAYVAN
jgi:DNA-binding beta-propeller fold protein YncE